MKPVLVIGLGGSGGKTLRATKDFLGRSYQEATLEKVNEEFLHFLHIDSTPVQDGVAFESPMLPQDDFLSLSSRHRNYGDLLHSATNNKSKDELRNDLSGWALPVPNIPIAQPPSMQRSIGGMLFYAERKFIEDAIRTKATNALKSSKVNNIVGDTKSTSSSSLEVLIVTSSAGGTGSGLLMGVKDLVQNLSIDIDISSVNLLVYLPEAVSYMPTLNDELAGNSFGTISEILTDRISEKSIKKVDYHFINSNFPILSGGISSTSSHLLDGLFFTFGKYLSELLISGQLSEFMKSLNARETDFGSHETRQLILSTVNKQIRSVSTWRYFWTGRRTRSLGLSIPMTNEEKVSVLTGLLISSFLGLRKIKKEPEGVYIEFIRTETANHSTSSLPFPLPLDSKKGSNSAILLAAILQTFTLAFIKFQESGNTEILEVFNYLLWLGRETNSTGSGVHMSSFQVLLDFPSQKQPAPSKVISDLVLNRYVPSESRPISELMEAAGKTDTDLREVLMNLISKAKSQYESFFEDQDDLEWHEVSEVWEMKSEILQAFSNLASYVEGLK